MWQGELRVKSTVTGVTPLDFREGGAELLRLIRAYNPQAPEDVVKRGRVNQVGADQHPTLDTFDHQVSQKRPRSQKERLVTVTPFVLDSFQCPLTMEVMRDPVITADGQTYERAEIERWFASGKSTSPMTGAELLSTTLTPNIALRNAIRESGFL